MRRHIAGMLASLLIATCGSLPAVAGTLGPEFVVNTYDHGKQEGPAVAALANGGFVIAWHSGQKPGADESGQGVYAQRYAASGARAGEEFLVNTTTQSHQSYPSIAGLSGGGFVIVWNSWLQDGAIYGQSFSASGARLGSEFKVPTHIADYNQNPRITALDGGGFLVVWQSRNQDTSFDIFGQRFSSAGVRVGGEFLVNTKTQNEQFGPSAVSLGSAGSAVAFETLAGGLRQLRAQRYNSAGVPAGGEFSLSDQPYPVQATMAPHNGGGFMAAYTARAGKGRDVFIRRISASGARIGDEVRVNTQRGWLTTPIIVPSISSRFVVIWFRDAPDDVGNGIYAQSMSAGGAPVGPGEFLVVPSASTFSWEQTFSAAGLKDGGFVVTWWGPGHQNEIRARVWRP
jgi:hypothetical protein